MKSLHQRVIVESETLIRRMKIARHVSLWKEDFRKLDPGDSKCSLFKHYIYIVCKYELFVISGIIIPLSMKILVRT